MLFAEDVRKNMMLSWKFGRPKFIHLAVMDGVGQSGP